LDAPVQSVDQISAAAHYFVHQFPQFGADGTQAAGFVLIVIAVVGKKIGDVVRGLLS
jgi:hypothetical protein